MTLVNALYSLAVGLCFGVLLYAVALLFPATRPLLVYSWRISPAGTILGCTVVGMTASLLFIAFGWWLLGVWFMFVLCSHLVVEVKRQMSKQQDS